MLYPDLTKASAVSDARAPEHVLTVEAQNLLPAPQLEIEGRLHRNSPLPHNSFHIYGDQQCVKQKTVCLLPGLFMRHSAYRDLANHLAQRGFKVVTLEFPNQPSHVDRPDYIRLVDYAKYLDSFLDTLNIKPEETLFFGMSFGAQILRYYHATLGRKCKALMLCSLFPWDLAATQVVEKMHLIDLIDRGNFEAFVNAFSLSLYSAVQKSRDHECVQRSVNNITNNFSHAPQKAKYLMMATMSSALNHQNKSETYEHWSSPTTAIIPKYDNMPFEHMQDYFAQYGIPSLVLPYGHVFTVECPNYADFVTQWAERYAE